MSIEITAAICTHNRASYLSKAIDSLVAQTLLPDEFEILVVDNASVDQTRQMVHERFANVANLRYCFEPVPGLSRARNVACREAQGMYVAYLDDDAIADRHWLERIVQVFKTTEPDVACVGGPIDLIWETRRPVWLADELLVGLGYLHLSDEPVILNAKQWLFGGNMAFPKEILHSNGGFDERLGRRGRKLLANEEIDLKKRLYRANYTYYYDPRILVQHHVPAARLVPSWFTRRAFWQGVSEAINRQEEEAISWGTRLRLMAVSVRVILQRFVDLAMPVRGPSAFLSKCIAVRHVGLIAGWWGWFDER